MITSDNPYSKASTKTENDVWREELSEVLVSYGFKSIPSIGQDPNGRWSPEKGFFVPGINFKLATSIGKQFNQNAILLGGDTGEAEILWLV